MIYVIEIFRNLVKSKHIISYHLRELLLNRCIGPATLVITESEKLKTMIFQQFSKDKNRIISIPNGPSPLLLNYSKIEHNKKN